jgi:uncharacterized protein DUF5947
VRQSQTLRALAQGEARPPSPEQVLRGFTGGVRERKAPGEQCEMCAVPIGPEHQHVADVADHRLLCTCRSCYLLFAPEGAGRGHYRSVPETYRANRGFTMDQAQWESLGIPVNLAFLFLQQDRYVAFYPSPGGATESLLDLGTWQAVVSGDPVLQSLAPDVEAVLLRRLDDGFECYVVPIDACYELVGLVRQYWQGFAGGEEVWQAIDGFFDAVRERCRP